MGWNASDGVGPAWSPTGATVAAGATDVASAPSPDPPTRTIAASSMVKGRDGRMGS